MTDRDKRIAVLSPIAWRTPPQRYGAWETVAGNVAEYLHISEAFEHAAEFDLIHSHYDFMALCSSRLVPTPVLTTIHGFSSTKIMRVYGKYRDGYYASISDADC